MIRILNGDLLEAEENVICHQVNCQGFMNSGIAKQIREKHMVAYNDYMNAYVNCENSEDLLGTVRVTKLGDNKFIAHLFSQFNYGYDGERYTSYDAFYEALSQVKKSAKSNGLSVAIPYKIGSDRGGADWDVIYKMIESIFEDYEVTIYKWEEK